MPNTASAVASRRLLGRGFQLYASAQAEPRARRPTDIALAIVSVVDAGALHRLRRGGHAFEAELVRLLDSLPGLFEPLWRLAFWAPVAYAAALIVVAPLARPAGPRP